MWLKIYEHAKSITVHAVPILKQMHFFRDLVIMKRYLGKKHYYW